MDNLMCILKFHGKKKIYYGWVECVVCARMRLRVCLGHEALWDTHTHARTQTHARTHTHTHTHTHSLELTLEGP